jgi:DNA-binding SARP family transcriptional activator
LAVQYRVLGSLEVVGGDGARVEVGGTQPRTLLAILVAAAGRIVPVDTLIDAIWPGRTPDSAAGTLQSYVSRLRRELEPERPRGAEARVLVWEPPGYRLDLDPDEVDFRRFERLADEGRDLLRAGDAEGARERLRAAEALWRGPALVEFADREWAQGLAVRLDERRIGAIEDRIAADLAVGDHQAVVGELTQLAGEHPLREELAIHLATALYRSGRQAEALRALARLRDTLLDELGVDPSPPVRELEARILDHDPTLAAVPRAPAGTVTTGRGAPFPSGNGSPPAGEPVDLDGFVGRQSELAQLVEAFDEAARGRARFAVVEGEPGIGKTRTLEALAEHAAARGAIVRWGRCHEGDAAPAFWPWLEILRDLVEREDREPSDEQIARLLAPAGVVGPPTERFALFEAVAAQGERIARTAPVLAIVDDLQWADTASLELYEFLAGRLTDSRVMLAASVRELDVGRNDAVVGALAAAARRSGTRRLRLRGLSEADTAALVARTTGTAPGPAVVRAIHERSDGNPFFVGELTRLVVTDAAADDVLAARAGVPASVRDVVHRRLTQLPEPTIRLLEAAAVLGREGGIETLARTAGLDLADTLTHLEPALTTRLLVDVPDAPATFRFAHALVREVVLGEVPVLRRSQLHQRAADAICAVVGDTDDTAEIVAAHLWAAVPLVDRARAAAGLDRAADVAASRYAWESAEPLLEQALQLRRAGASDPDDLVTELLTIGRLAAIRRVRYGYAASIDEASMARAGELARATGRLDQLADLLWLEWSAAATSCRLDVAGDLARNMLTVAEESDDPWVRAFGHTNWGVHCWHVGRITEAAHHLDRGAELRAQVPDAPDLVLAPTTVQLEAELLGIAFGIVMHELVGDIEDGSERLAALAAQQTNPYGVAVIWNFEGFAGVLVGDPVRAATAGRRGLASDPDSTFSFFGAACGICLAWALAELGEIDEALALYAEHLPRYAAHGIRTTRAIQLGNHALALARAGRHEDAAAEMAAAERELAETGERFTEPMVLMTRAEVDVLAGGDLDTAAARIDRAVSVATEQGSHTLARRARSVATRIGC